MAGLRIQVLLGLLVPRRPGYHRYPNRLHRHPDHLRNQRRS